ncbi:hypothetical protein H9Q72_001726 [Fusarium xylarioides]|uniref:Uncharacterized protein n=1 Tax=Fusarium xylarioides TaxID=221167 RepID=A0A9P7I9X7_9HYPO|nr:hypothetical protein H9Q70_003952 [Fusarium xylarioides]KAG5771902.1 hypothetical protein H9Q72_001726 [Fusarium xylarioides]KAG5813770.1 hypothetical protein H9Q71_003549 [Fusarium xylarioides]KAG5827732.1 hypothetical protein H9Q74_002168 [Fusarium xylarioides]
MKVGSVEAVVLLRYRKKEQRRRLPMKPTCNRFVSLTGPRNVYLGGSVAQNLNPFNSQYNSCLSQFDKTPALSISRTDKQTNEQRTSALFPLEHPSIALSLTRQSLFPLFDTRSSIRCFKTLSAL